MMLVTHRGPYRFSVRDDGSFDVDARRRRHRQRAAAAGAAATTPASARPGSRPPSTTTTAPRSPPARASVAGLDLHLLDLDPALHRMHYDVISNAVLWFLHHGLFDLARRPRFDRHLREAWEGYVAVNAAFADAVAERRGRRRTGARARLPARARPRDGARRPPRPPGHPLHPHAVLRAELDPGAPDRHGRGAVLRRWRRCRPGSTPTRWARGVRRRRRARCSARDSGRALRRPRSAPIPTRWPSSPPSPATAARRGRARRAGRRPEARVAQRSHRPVEEHRARLPRVRRAARDRTPSGASAWCSSRCSTGHARASPSTSPTSRRSTRPPSA